MTSTEEQQQTGFAIEAKLAGVAPKAGNASSYDEGKKDNTLVLTFELKLPAPTPPQSFDKWANDWQGGNRVKQNLERQLTEFTTKARKVKPTLGTSGPRGTHWFTEPSESSEALELSTCKTCKALFLERDVEKCIDPRPRLVEAAALVERTITDERDRLSLQLREAYATYHAEATNKMNRAFVATLGSGLFVAMLGQMVELTFRPSSALFQPMLDATFAVQRGMPTAMAALMPPESPDGLNVFEQSAETEEDDDDDDDDEEEGDEA